jgi:exonuclease 3'-5' domain-containing protein 1
MPSQLIDTEQGVRALLGEIEASNLDHPFLFLDLEGVSLGRHGTISILQVLVPPSRTIHLLDVHILGSLVFSTKSSTGTSLKHILESSEYPKVFFDLRNDSDALYAHFGVKLNCVIDVQLLEFGTPPRPGRFLKGLAKSIAEDSGLGYQQIREWQASKELGHDMFDPKKGGSYEVFNHRPLDKAIVEYCARDVLLLPVLLQVYASRLRGRGGLAQTIQLEAEHRIALSQRTDFDGRGQHMALGLAGLQ